VKYLLDTNVLSEIRKSNGNAAVKAFVSKIRDDDIYISAISIGEICHGIEKLPEGPKKTELSIWLGQNLKERFHGKIISLDANIMMEWGRLQARSRTLPLFDSLIAASALAHRFTIVTRNIKDFDKIEGLLLLNPWETESTTPNPSTELLGSCTNITVSIE
jgi:predicted nucleic acid-binding protein